MKQIGTQLLKQDDLALKIVHLAERFNGRNVNVQTKVLDWKTHDVVTVICQFADKYLIGKLKGNYEFCPGDWDFLTPHLQEGEDLKEKSLDSVRDYASLEPVGILRAYHSFMWLDFDSKLWWHFLPFRIRVENNKFKINPNGKYSEFRWVRKEEFPEYSRQGYLEVVCSKTLDVDYLYVGDYVTVFDEKRGFFSFFPYED